MPQRYLLQCIFTDKMKTKIHFGEKPVFLCDRADEEISELLHHPDAVLVDELSHHAIHALLHEIKKDSFHAGVLMHPDTEAMKKMFFHHFTCMEAAGGVVKNGKEETLFIFRRGKWDLPKGKMEEGEEPAICAAREIEEETGVASLSLIKKICETYHVYEDFGKTILKTTHWFSFTTTCNDTPVPQTEEDITEVRWVAEREIPELMKNTYGSIQEVVGCR